VCQLLRTYTSLYGRLGASWKGGHERKQPVLRSWRNHGNCGVSLDEIILSFFPAQKWGVVSTVWRSRVSFSRVHVTFTHTSVLYCSLSLSLCFFQQPFGAGSTPSLRQQEVQLLFDNFLCITPSPSSNLCIFRIAPTHSAVGNFFC
jgi:hypothetical protein